MKTSIPLPKVAHADVKTDDAELVKAVARAIYQVCPAGGRSFESIQRTDLGLWIYKRAIAAIDAMQKHQRALDSI